MADRDNAETVAMEIDGPGVCCATTEEVEANTKELSDPLTLSQTLRLVRFLGEF